LPEDEQVKSKRPLYFKDLESSSVPIDTRATRVKESQNTSMGNTSNSEKLNYLHPSILTNPDIRKTKIAKKNLRDKDRRNSYMDHLLNHVF